MTLRQRTLLIIGLTLIGLNAVLYGISSRLLVGSSVRAEEQDTRQLVQGVLNVFSQNLAQFNARYADWSSWDDTYTFVQNGNQEFIQTNLIDTQLSLLRLNLILFINSSGRVVFGTGFDLDKTVKTPVPEALKPHLVLSDRLLQHPHPDSSVSGIILLPEGPMMIAARPILNSAGQGPIRGTLIVGRYLNVKEIQQLENITRLPLTLQPVDEPQLATQLQGMRSIATTQQSNIWIQPLNDGAISGYALLKDIYDKPALLLSTEGPRTIYEQGKAAIGYLTWAILLVGLVFSLVTLLLLEQLVLSRLARLSVEVGSIGSKGDVSQRVTATGQDELSNLADRINAMLRAIEHYQQERQQVAQELEAAKEAAEQASIAKSQFLANMSHELRTPLTAIIGYSEMLQEEAIDLEQQSLVVDLKKIQNAGEHLLGLINDILDLSKIEAGKMAMDLQVFDVPLAIKDIVQTVQPLVEKNNNTLVVHCPSDIGTMSTDLTKVRQNLLNLLSNASKFTHAGTITLTVERGEEETPGDAETGTEDAQGYPQSQPNQPLGRSEVARTLTHTTLTPPPLSRLTSPCIRFTVSDTGIGISSEQMQNLFQPFMQADTSTTRKYGGTGLGLAITHHFCQMLGGTINVASELGQGSTFTMSLPRVLPTKFSDRAAESP